MGAAGCCCTKPCIICEEDFSTYTNTSVEAEIEAQSSCPIDVSGTVSIVDDYLRIDGGSVTFTPETSYVYFTVRAASAGAKAIITLNDVILTLTFGSTATDGVMAFSGAGIVAPVSQQISLIANSTPKTFLLCIGPVTPGIHAGARSFRFSGSEPSLGAQLVDDTPDYPYGQVVLSNSVSAVEFALVKLRDTNQSDAPDTDDCPNCRPNICPIFVDDTSISPFFHPFSTSKGQWTNQSGFGVGGYNDNIASLDNSKAVAATRNPQGLGVLAFFAGWIWNGEGVVRLELACDSGGTGARFVAEISNYSLPRSCCTRLYKEPGSVLISEVYNNHESSTFGTCYMYYNGTDAWLGVNEQTTFNQYLGKHGDTSVGGGHVAIGTGDLDDGAYVEFFNVTLDWYAHSPDHTTCPSDPRFCCVLTSYSLMDHAWDLDNLPCGITLTGTWTDTDIGGGVFKYLTTDGKAATSWVFPDENFAYAEWLFDRYGYVDGVGGSPDSVRGCIFKCYSAGANPIIVETLGAAEGSGVAASFYEVTFGGTTGIQGIIETGTAPAGDSTFHQAYTLKACFGSALTRAEIGVAFGHTTAAANETASASTAWAVEADMPGDAAAGDGIALSVCHTSESVPDNSLAPGGSTSCIDCHNPQTTTNCTGDGLPATMKITVAPIVGADMEDALCAADITKMTGTFTMTKSLQSSASQAIYQYYLHYTDRTALEDWLDAFTCTDNPCVIPICYWLVLNTGSGDLVATLTMYGLCSHDPGAPIAGAIFTWSGTLSGPIDCTSFDFDLSTPGSVLANDQWEASVETP